MYVVLLHQNYQAEENEISGKTELALQKTNLKTQREGRKHKEDGNITRTGLEMRE
jgi:hypothetical protein